MGGGTGGQCLLIADTRAQVDLLNKMMRDHRVATGEVDDCHTIVTADGGRIGAGDRVVTRRNDRELDVANRETWTIEAITIDTQADTQAGTHGGTHGGDGGHGGEVTLRGRSGVRHVPASYARDHLALGYATTVYGAQGETVAAADLILSEHTNAASAYVGMTRGRTFNTAHLVAETVEDARRQWIEVFTRDRADLGPTHAATLAADDVDRYGTAATPADSSWRLQAAVLRRDRNPDGGRDLRSEPAPSPRRPRHPHPGSDRNRGPGVGR